MNSCKGLCEEVSKLVSCRDVMDRDSAVFDLVATVEILVRSLNLASEAMAIAAWLSQWMSSGFLFFSEVGN